MEILAYIYENYTYIVDFFINSFNVDKNQANNTVEVLLKCVARDEFYADTKLDDVISIFNKQNVYKIQNFFAASGVTREQMVQVIVQIPEILFYINKLENVFLIYKNEEFVGYLLRKGENYQAYRLLFPKNSYEEESEEEIINRWRITNIPEQIHVVDNHSYSKMIDKVLYQLKSRSDLRKEYGISDDATTEEMLYALTKRYKTNDLYLKVGPKL